MLLCTDTQQSKEVGMSSEDHLCCAVEFNVADVLETLRSCGADERKSSVADGEWLWVLTVVSHASQTHSRG